MTVARSHVDSLYTFRRFRFPVSIFSAKVGCVSSICLVYIRNMSDNNEEVPDITKFNEDSVPPAEKPIEHKHPGRPDLDYEDTPVGQAPGVDYISKEKLEKKEEKVG